MENGFLKELHSAYTARLHQFRRELAGGTVLLLALYSFIGLRLIEQGVAPLAPDEQKRLLLALVISLVLSCTRLSSARSVVHVSILLKKVQDMARVPKALAYFRSDLGLRKFLFYIHLLFPALLLLLLWLYAYLQVWVAGSLPLVLAHVAASFHLLAYAWFVWSVNTNLNRG